MLIPISNTPRDYAWGSQTAIAALQHRSPSGAPEAEVWLGDHPGSPAQVDDGSGRTLIDWLAAERSGRSLTFLVKILAAASPLSIQAHPTVEQAREGFARENAAGVPIDAADRNYRDDNHKPEVIVALSDPFLALAGFRAVDDTLTLLEAIGGDGAREIARRVQANAGDLGAVVAWLLSARDGELEARAAVDDLEAHVRSAAEDAPAEVHALARIAGHYPNDPGIAVAALLNLVRLAPGEAVFVPAGAPHAYLEGVGVEVMAASDNVLRGGLTPKHIDVPELLSVLSASAGAPPRLEARPAGPGLWRFDPPVDDFRLVRVSRPIGAAVEVSGAAPAVVVAVGDSATVTQGDSRVDLARGAAAFATPEGGPLLVSGDAIVAFGRDGS